ncbi:MAG: cache domain-containing protein, partial [Candidatus Promineifilaceae bacterium]|nr:cache domain-containing protein [Candidatus Promineifilaceae bacterium]
GLVAASAYERAQDHLVGAGRFAAEVMIEHERGRLATLRAVTNTEGVPQAVAASDEDRLARLVPQIILNNQEAEIVSLVDADGDEIFSWQQIGLDSGRQYEGQEFSGMPALELVLQEQVDEHGTRRSSLVEREDGWYLYTLGPIYQEGRLVGAALVGSSVEPMVFEIAETGLADLILYDREGEVVATSLSNPAQIENALATTLADLGLNREGPADTADWYHAITSNASERVPLQHLTISGKNYLLAYGDWRVREDSIGFFSVARPSDTLVSTAATSRSFLPPLFLLGTVALFVTVGLMLARSRTSSTALIVIVASALFGVLVVLLLVFTAFPAESAPQFVAASLLPESSVSYHAPPLGPLFAPLSPSVVDEIAEDEELLEEDEERSTRFPAPQNAAEIFGDFQLTPTPGTRVFDAEGEPAPVGTAGPSAGTTATSTARPFLVASATPTDTDGGSLFGSPTPTPSSTPSATSRPSATATPTRVQEAIGKPSSTPSRTPSASTTRRATASPSPTSTSTPTPSATTTSTSVPPTATSTPRPSATSTSVPPTATSTPRPSPTATPLSARQQLSPWLSCVRDNDNGTHTAIWGYSNPNNYTVAIPIGGQNHVVPSPQDQGQPTSFSPGSHIAFSSTFESDKWRVWKLDDREARADAGSTLCD